MKKKAGVGISQWCRGSTRVSGTLNPGSTPGWDVFIVVSHWAVTEGSSDSKNYQFWINVITSYIMIWINV